MRYYKISLRVKGQVEVTEQAGHDVDEALRIALYAASIKHTDLKPGELTLAAAPEPLDRPTVNPPPRDWAVQTELLLPFDDGQPTWTRCAKGIPQPDVEHEQPPPTLYEEAASMRELRRRGELP